MFNKILVANRGEIACRVMRTAQRLGIQTVAVYSDADQGALHVLGADEAIHIGGSAPAESYLDMKRVIDAARQTGADAIHPGYGFLSENATFAQRCGEAGITFIGPPAAAITVMGSKSAAKQAMASAGVPLLPGYHEADQDPALLKQAADDIGYPVLLKAVAGGGGKGMREVHSADEFDEALAAARREAQSGFGNADMLLEKFLLAPRHVEVQVFCDSHGNGVYLFERDCSVQRRHQKIIEEAPAPGLHAALRQAMGEAAVRAAQAVDYVGAGTVEFLLDGDAFYFMEMNTRLQVEHPVTEMITGQDLVAWQFSVAAGDALPLAQADLSIHGHSFEARIYAEDPDNDFLPAAGRINAMQQPTESTAVRVDTGVATGDEIGVFYDPMIAKLITWGEDRDAALRQMVQALGQYRITGVTTNNAFLQQLAQHPAFAAGDVSTNFIDRHRDALLAGDKPQDPGLPLLAALFLLLESRTVADGYESPWDAPDAWRPNAANRQQLMLTVQGNAVEVTVDESTPGSFLMTCDERQYEVVGSLSGYDLSAIIGGHQVTAQVLPDADGWVLFTGGTAASIGYLPPDLGFANAPASTGAFNAPMNGTVVEINVSAGDTVTAGQTVAVIEAMKMEHAIKTPTNGTVTEVFFVAGDLVDGGTALISFQPEETADEG